MKQFFFPGIYSCTGILNNYWKKMGEYEITGLGKKVVWVFPKRNGKIIGWLVGIPRGGCKTPLTAS